MFDLFGVQDGLDEELIEGAGDKVDLVTDGGELFILSGTVTVIDGVLKVGKTLVAVKEFTFTLRPDQVLATVDVDGLEEGGEVSVTVMRPEPRD